jgi:peptidoglycan/LPS O-acetylase OafA/YrhL
MFGATGVTMFFTLSGFLITALLLEEKQMWWLSGGVTVTVSLVAAWMSPRWIESPQAEGEVAADRVELSRRWDRAQFRPGARRRSERQS